jgi:hypothetical protein
VAIGRGVGRVTTAVGAAVGKGRWVGSAVGNGGNGVGMRKALVVGIAVGSGLGFAVGTNVGTGVGTAVGASVGCGVTVNVGLGPTVGVSLAVGDGVGLRRGVRVGLAGKGVGALGSPWVDKRRLPLKSRRFKSMRRSLPDSASSCSKTCKAKPATQPWPPPGSGMAYAASTARLPPSG